MLKEKATDKSFWIKVREDEAYRPLIDDVFKMYEESTQKPIEAFKYSEYKEFFRNGVRKTYEDGYFLKRFRLNSCAILSLIYPEEEKYLTELSDIIWAICDEYTWALPAHALGNETVDENLIDLFAAETGFALSEIKYLLSDRLDNITKERISKEIKHRIFEPFNTRNFWWYTSTNNWSAVCGTGVAACFMYEAPDEFCKIKPRIDEIMECFFKGFKEDGVCREGLSYWGYGFGLFICYADMLRRFSCGMYDYFKEERVKKIAEFSQNMFLDENVTVSFSDSSMTGKSRIGVMHMLKEIYGDEIKISSKSCSIIADKRWSSLLRAFLYFDKKYAEENPLENKEIYYNSSDWFIKKSENYGFAAKGGDNAEPHNHNDIGSFIFASKGKQILCDLGAGEYTAQYFSPDACEKVFCRHSFSHSVPIINGKGQQRGEQYNGNIKAEKGKILIELKEAYEKGALEKLTRTFIFEDKKVILNDSLKLSGNYKERFVTILEPVIKENMVVIDNLCSLNYDKHKFSAEIYIHTHRMHSGEEKKVYLIDFVPNKYETTEFKMEICMLD